MAGDFVAPHRLIILGEALVQRLEHVLPFDLATLALPEHLADHAMDPAGHVTGDKAGTIEREMAC